MKKSFYYLPKLTLLLILFCCKEIEEPLTAQPTTPLPEGLERVIDVKIELPSKMELDFSKAELSTGLMSFPINPSGESKAILPKDHVRIAYLFDGEDKLKLMGLLHEGNLKINYQTTAQVLLFLSSYIYIGDEESIRVFLEQYATLPGITEFEEKIGNQLTSSADYLANGDWNTEISDFLESVIPKEEEIDIRGKQINVSPTSEQSGLMVFENDAQSIKIRNSSKRFTEAFIYKTSVKKTGQDQETIILPSISKDTKADTQALVPSAGGLGSINGVIFDALAGKGTEVFAQESNPINLVLGSDEDEATYKVRVVGTSFRPNDAMTSAEEEKWKYLMFKQFVFDFVSPVMSKLFSELNDDDNGELKNAMLDYLINQSPPNIWKLIESGDWKGAIFDTVKFFAENGGAVLQEILVNKLVDKYENVNTKTWIDLDRDYNNAKSVDRYLQIVSVIENGMSLANTGWLFKQLLYSERLEEFTAKAIRNEVKITPKESSVVPFSDLQLTAEANTAVSGNQVLVYKWSTTGKYGFIVGTGNQKGVEIETSSKSVNFRSETPSGQLQENNIETVQVEVYIKEGTKLNFVGKAEAQVNVKKYKNVMKPDDIVLSGKKKHAVTLYLERLDGVVDIVSTASLEYKVEWSTEGKYGKLEGNLNHATTRGNKISYQALDDEVKEATETITAYVYFRTPGSPSWTLREKISGTLKILNDPRYEIIDIPLTVATHKYISDPGGYYTGGVVAMAVFPVYENAVRYTLKCYGLKSNFWAENKVYAWNAGQVPPVTASKPGLNPDQTLNGSYYFSIFGGGCQSNGDGCWTTVLPKTEANITALGGRANIVIELKD